MVERRQMRVREVANGWLNLDTGHVYKSAGHVYRAALRQAKRANAAGCILDWQPTSKAGTLAAQAWGAGEDTISSQQD